MRQLKKILLFLYSVYALMVFWVFMIILLPAILLPSFISLRASVISFAAVRLWAYIFTFLTGVRVKFTGKENLQKDKAHILVSNHTSFLDVVSLVMLFNRPIRPLGKVELLKIPVFGWIVSRLTVVVDRSSRESRNKSVERLVELTRNSISILIFPEGTMNRTSSPLLRFHSGAFRIAQESKVPIIPIAIANAGNLLPPRGFKMRPGTIRVSIGKEIDPDKMSAGQMSDTTYRWIKEQLGH